MEPLLSSVDATFPKWIAGLLNAKIDEFGYGLLNMGHFCSCGRYQPYYYSR